MDWSTIGGLVAQAAPTIGGLLGGFIPFPGGAFLGELAGKAVAAALGVPPTPEAVHEAVTTGDPDVIKAKLASADAQMQADVEKYRLELADIQNARATNVQLVHEHSPIAWGAPIVSILITIGFLGSLAVLMTTKANFTEVSGQALLLLIGSLATMQTQVVNYWLGSSHGSADKSAQIAALASVGKPVTKPVKR